MEKFRSRKFLITVLSIISAVVLASLSKMDANVAIVLGAAITSYNLKDIIKK